MSGYDNIFRGIIKCADCGSAMLAKVEQRRKRSNVIDRTFYCCTRYCKFGKEGCSSHNIEAWTVHEVVLADIQKHAQQALTDRKAMVTEIAKRLNPQLSADKEQQKKELRQCRQRVSEIENLYAKLRVSGSLRSLAVILDHLAHKPVVCASYVHYIFSNHCITMRIPVP